MNITQRRLLYMSNYEIRAKAREQLGKNIFSEQWLMALVVCLIVTAINGFASSVSLGIAMLILTGPLSVGVAKIFLSLARGANKINIEDEFSGFKDFTENLLLGLLTSVFIFLWSLLFVIPGIVKSYAYSMAYYIKVDHPEYTWRECLDESQEMMRGHKLDCFLLDLSFIGWFIVGALCCGVGTLWVIPYQRAARANFYESIRPFDVEQNSFNNSDSGESVEF